MTNIDVNENNKAEPIDFESAFELTKREVDRALSASPSLIREYTKHLSKSTGKFIRAVSLLVCSEDENGLIDPDAVKLAASIELLHLATLVHDDVIDNAELRRGEVSLQKKYGKRTAVICGDYLLCVSLKTAASVRNKRDYLDLEVPDYMSRVCLGELNQHFNNGNFDLSVFKYLKIISGKTAALFEACFYAGAVLCGCEEAAIREYAKLGRYIGMIFQLTDDCMDFESTESEARKPVQSDYEQSVITLPLIHALKNLSGLKEKARTGELTKDDINRAVINTGGLGYTRLIAKKYYNKSSRIINELNITQDKKRKLTSILDKAFRVF